MEVGAFISITDENTKKYSFFKKFCKYLKGISFQKYQEEKHLLSGEFKKIISNVKGFDINDVLVDHDARYRYTTPLEYILMTKRDDIISSFLTEHIDLISFELNSPYQEDLLMVLYKNLTWRGCPSDVLLPLIYKSENLNFLAEESSVSKKLQMVSFMILQKDNYECSESFLEVLETKNIELLEQRELHIISEIALSAVQSQARVNDDKYPKSERLTKLGELLEKFSADLENLKGEKQ